MTTICCVCNKTKSRKNWVKKNVPSGMILSHGYCPDCFKITLKKIQQSFAHLETG